MQRLALSPTYRRSLFKDMTRFMVLLLVGIEAIYLSDKVLTDLVFEALNYGHGFNFLVRSTLLAMPQILLLGLPLALVVTVFLVLLQRRETGDFVALAPVGFAPTSLLTLGLGAGIMGFVAALGIGGVLAPLAEHRLAQVLHSARYAVLSSGDPGLRTVIEIEGATILYHRLAPGDETSARLFLHAPDASGDFQIITARASQFRFDTTGGDGALVLQGAQVTGFSMDEDAALQRTMGLRVAQMLYRAGALAIPPFPSRETQVSMLTLPELLAPPAGVAGAAPEAALRIVLAAVLALLAPLVAVVAMGLTRGPLVPVAGPVGVGLVLAGGFGLSQAALWLAPLGLWPGLGLALVAGFGLVALLALAMLWLGDALLTPARLPL